MSNESRETIKSTKETFKKLAEVITSGSDQVNALGDKKLSEYIFEIRNNAEQIVKHIEERSDEAL